MHLIGIDGGGTRTTVVVADGEGRELVRRTGGAGIVDPRWPLAAAESVVKLVREVMAAARIEGPAAVLCAGLAGSGDPESREVVLRGLAGAGVARQVEVVSDGEIALEGAFRGAPGVLLIAGTGSAAWGRGPDGRVERCGGWGAVLGDEGSAYWLGREALRAVLRAEDGRGASTGLAAAVAAGWEGDVDRLAGRIARASKAEVAGLAPRVLEQAEAGDEVAAALVAAAVAGAGEHAVALARRLGPWSGGVPVVLHGGLAAQPRFAAEVTRWLGQTSIPFRIVAPAADAAAGAVLLAIRAAS